MENQDFFREIAMTKHPIGTLDKEVEPIPVPDVWFWKEEKQGIEEGRPIEQSFAKRCEGFWKELENQRSQYRPFLENHLPKLPKEVRKLSFEEFEFRYLEPGEVFTERNLEASQWEKVTIPDYRGPAEENGKWKAYYRCEFSGIEFQKERETVKDEIRAVLDFQCVDYIAEIYVNDNFVGRHEGFFAPFSFDITDYIKDKNELVILCKNDYTMLGTGPLLDGDKIYAATGPGWDDPHMGWHHCPAGGGVFGKVELNFRPVIYIEDLFVRPDIDDHSVEIRVGIWNYSDRVKEGYDLFLNLLPKNFKGDSIGEQNLKVSYIGPGKNEYRYYISVSNYRLWNPDTPWLYGAQAILKQKEQVVSSRTGSFGMKKFISDEKSNPKGKFYLNNRPIVLRGANEMGHLQQCVMEGNMSQLIDDILIAKMCHMNYYRVTQRPVQEEIYDYFDMLGMMHQCDLPMFGFLRRPQFFEAIRQTGEMEHMVRRHVSTCMVTFINEPMCIRKTKDPEDKFSKRYEAKGHRHLMRDELEAFFAAARKAIYVENPDRVIKNVEGDYDGPTLEGMPDFHCYTMWYTNHGEPIGKLMRGYLPPVKEGWMIGCGEYGAEGLDNENMIRSRYPKSWLETDEKGRWFPDKIVRAQTHSVHGDWYPEQETIKDWVLQSQIHQANATKLMTDAFRRRGDVMNHTAIHLLIDAWPSGWMKTLVDCERQPKRAYFSYQDALFPKRINLYTGRNCVYEDELVEVEAWILNDTGDEEQIKVVVSLWEDGGDHPYATYSKSGEMKAAWAGFLGKIPVSFQSGNKDRRKVLIKASLINNENKIINQETITFQVYQRKSLEETVYTCGDEAKKVGKLLAKNHGLDQKNRQEHRQEEGTWLFSNIDEKSMKALETHIKNGGKGVLLLPEKKTEVLIGGEEVRLINCGGVFFGAARDEYKDFPITMLYQQKKGYIDVTASYTIETDLPGRELVFTYDKKGFNGSTGAKKHLPFVKECKMGKGTLVLVSLSLEGRIGYNPGLDRLLLKLLTQ